MVMKINDTRALNQPSAFGSAGQLPDAVPQMMVSEVSSLPAAKIDLNHTVQTTRNSALDSTGGNLDIALIKEIQQRIKNGTFQIDHTQIAQSLLRDAVLATRP